MKRFLLTLWQFPQYLLGLIICICCFRKIKHIFPCGNSVIVRVEGLKFGMSLGCAIFIPTGSEQKTIKRKLGYSILSLYFGWLYLPIVCLFHPLTSKWADKFGGNTK